MQINWLSNEQKSLIILQYISGEKLPQLAKNWKLSYMGLNRWLKKNKVKIRKDNFLSNKKYFFNINIFNNINTQEKAYWLGFLYADGNNFVKRNTVCLGLAEIDKEHINKFAKFIGINRPIEISKKKNPNQQDIYRICASNHHFSQKLIKLGVVNNKTFKLTFPKNKILPKNLVWHFIRGYFDGDGSIYCSLAKRGKRPSFRISFVGTLDLVSGIEKYLKKLKINSYIRPRHKERNHNIRQLEFGGNTQVEKFCNILYQNAKNFLPRKYEKFLYLKKMNLFKFKPIIQLDKNNNIIREFSSSIEAANHMDCHKVSIESLCNGNSKFYKNGVCKGKRKFYKGFKWQYKKQTLEDFMKL